MEGKGTTTERELRGEIVIIWVMAKCFVPGVLDGAGGPLTRCIGEVGCL